MNDLALAMALYADLVLFTGIALGRLYERRKQRSKLKRPRARDGKFLKTVRAP